MIFNLEYLQYGGLGYVCVCVLYAYIFATMDKILENNLYI